MIKALTKIFLVSIAFLFCFSLVPNTFGASDTFTVGLQFGSDTTPPTTPGSLVAIPVATTQINLSWATSTDVDTSVAGYQVFRDAVQIATTTATSYSDAALMASTTYAYYIVAFDTFFNYSSSSAVVSTTTLKNPATTTPTTTPSTTGGVTPRLELEEIPLVVTDFEIIPGETNAVVRFATPSYVRATLRWGQSEMYELGVQQEGSFLRTHEITITNLDPATRYYVELTGENQIGNSAVLRIDSFVTNPEGVFVTPPNVLDFRGRKEGNDIVLNWRNPDFARFEKVRVLRSGVFFPTDPVDGYVIYEGAGEYFRDKEAAVPGTTQYYTIFVYGTDGTVSSGAIVALSIPFTDTDVTAPVPVGVVDESVPQLNFADLHFYQNGERLVSTPYSVELIASAPVTVFVPYQSVPEHLKTIVLTLTHPIRTSTHFSVLLRVNGERSGYEATIASLIDPGVYPTVAQVFDYKTENILWAKGDMVVRASRVDLGQQDSSQVEESERFVTTLELWSALRLAFFILLLLVLVIAAYLLWRSRRRS